jgi:membrane protease YdiL (CAAX protease family)
MFAGLVVAIAATNLLVNTATPSGARVPVKLVIAALYLLWARRGAGLTWEELGLARAHARAGLRIGCFAAVGIAGAIGILVALPTRSFFESDAVAADSATQRVLMVFVVIPLGTAVFEEVIFRGVLLAVLLRKTTTRNAVVVSSVLFGLWHLHSAVNDASGEGVAATIGIVAGTIVVTTLAGAGFAYLRLRSQSLVAPAVAHAALNSIAYVGAIVALS